MKLKWAALYSFALLFVFSAVGFLRAETGEGNYKKLCVKCHGEAGKGDGPAAKMLKGQAMGDLSSKAAMSKMSDPDLAKLISEGGAAVGKSKVMPAHKDKMSDADIKAVVTYIKTLQK